jgi:hypothetical protein
MRWMSRVNRIAERKKKKEEKDRDVGWETALSSPRTSVGILRILTAHTTRSAWHRIGTLKKALRNIDCEHCTKHLKFE